MGFKKIGDFEVFREVRSWEPQSLGEVKIYGKQLALGRLLAPFNLMGFTSNENSYVVLLWFYCDETYSTEKKYSMEQILD